MSIFIINRLKFLICVGCFCAARIALCADLEAVFSDRGVQPIAVRQYEGVEYVSYKTLRDLLQRIDPQAHIANSYDPNELRIIVTGKSITITEGRDHIVVDGRIKRPQYPLRVIGGEILVPVETLQEINDSLKLMELRGPGVETPLVETPAVALSTTMPASAATSLPTIAPIIPEAVVQPPPELAPQTLPALEPLPQTEATQPTTMPSSSPSVPSLLGQVNTGKISTIGIIPFTADRKTYGKNAEAASDITDQAAQMIRQALERSGRFTVKIADLTWNAQTHQKAIDWANTAQCDALIAVTVDSAIVSREQGIRLMFCHEANDAGARAAFTGARRNNLPQKLNYIPYQQKSLQLARAMYDELSKSPSLNVQPVEMAPVFLLRRAALPSVEISLGSVSSQIEREKISRGQFAEDLGRAVTMALEKIQTGQER